MYIIYKVEKSVKRAYAFKEDFKDVQYLIDQIAEANELAGINVSYHDEGLTLDGVDYTVR